MKKLIKQNYFLLLSPIITVIVLLSAFYINGVFPFGSTTVDYYDMAPGIIPEFYHIWDALHSGDTALFFNWYTGLGVNDTAITSFSLFWAVLLVIPRTVIQKAMSIYVVMFFAGSAFTSSIFLKKCTKATPFWCSVLSLCYAFCGYSVMYYTNAWEDTVLFFPIFMLSWLLLMKKGKSLPYILSIVYGLMTGYYVFTLLMMYVFFMSWLYLRLAQEKETRKKRALNLGLSTLLGYGISAVFFVPKMSQTLMSQRFSDTSEMTISSMISRYKEVATTIVSEYKSYDKLAMLFAIALPLAIILIGIVKNKKEKKINAFFVLNILLLLVLIVCEGSNALMHFGDYRFFPMRMGYALTFGFVWAAGYYSNSIKAKRLNLKSKNRKEIYALLLNIIAFCVFFVATFLVIKKVDVISDFQYAYLFVTPFLFVIYLVILSRSNRLFDYRIVTAGLLAEILMLTILFVPFSATENNDQEHNGSYISKTQKLVSNFDISSSKTDRIKTIGTTLNCNYGTIAERSTIADWTHLIPQAVQDSLDDFGYSSDYTRLHDSGGTAFTDALFNITNILSIKEESSALYNLLDASKGYNYYECKYTLQNGIVTSENFLNSLDEDDDWKSLNNKFYTVLSKSDENIVDDANLTLKSKSDKTEIYTFKSKSNTTSYFKLTGADRVEVYVNGERIVIPSVDRENYKKYPARFNRNLINLGEFGDSEVELKLVFTHGKYESDDDKENDEPFFCEVGLLDLQKLSSVCEKYSDENYNVIAKNYSLTATVNAGDDNEIFLIPLEDNGSWSVTVNGEKRELSFVNSVFACANLSKGENDIKMSFVPNGMKLGAVISGVSLLLAIVFIALKNKDNKATRIADTVVSSLYDIVFFGALCLIYVIPILYLFYYVIRHII